jgi:hypothetical protein
MDGTLIGPTAQWLPTQLWGVGFLGVRQLALVDREPRISVWGVGVAPEAIVGPPCQWVRRFGCASPFDVSRRRLIAPGLLCRLEELRHALLRCPMSSGK